MSIEGSSDRFFPVISMGGNMYIVYE